MKIKTIYIVLLTLIIYSCAFSQKQVEVHFDFNKYNINDSAKEKLDQWLTENKNIEVTKIYGYCDWVGTNLYNDTLSLKRVSEIFNFLKDNNIIVRKDYEIKGFGEDFKQSKVQSENRKVIIAYEEIKPEIPPVEEEKTPKTLAEQVKNAKPGDLIKLQNINFFNNSDVVVPKSRPILADLLCIMEDNPKLKIEIQGHICCQPIQDVNDISTKRARAVYAYLVRNKINRTRLSYKGFGITKPIHPIPEKSEAEENENRRVEILIVEN